MTVFTTFFPTLAESARWSSSGTKIQPWFSLKHKSAPSRPKTKSITQNLPSKCFILTMIPWSSRSWVKTKKNTITKVKGRPEATQILPRKFCTWQCFIRSKNLKFVSSVKSWDVLWRKWNGDKTISKNGCVWLSSKPWLRACMWWADCRGRNSAMAEGWDCPSPGLV